MTKKSRIAAIAAIVLVSVANVFLWHHQATRGGLMGLPNYAGPFQNIQGWGAKGDGVTDDTAAIQNALNGSSTGTLYFPDGTYLISATLTPQSNQRLLFSKNASLLCAPTWTGSTDSNRDAIYINGLHDITLQGVTINGNYTNNPTGALEGIRIFGASTRISLYDCYCHDMPDAAIPGAAGDGIYIGPLTSGSGVVPTFISLDHCRCDSNHRLGLAISGVQYLTVTGGSYSNTVYTSPGPGMGIDIESNSGSDPTSEITIQGAKIVGNGGGGMQIGGQIGSAHDISVVGNTIETTLSTYNDSITSNTVGLNLGVNAGLGIVVDGNHFAGGYYCIYNAGGTRGVRITNNQFRDCRTAYRTLGTQDNFSHNCIKAAWEYAVYCSAGTNHRITNNDAYDCGNSALNGYVYAIGDGVTGSYIKDNFAFDDRSAPTGGVPATVCRLPSGDTTTLARDNYGLPTSQFTNIYVNRIAAFQQLKYTISQNGSLTTVANTASKTTLFTNMYPGGTSLTPLTANWFTAGKTWSINAKGYLSDTGTPTIQFKVEMGATPTVMLDSTAITLPSGVTNAPWEFHGDIYCRVVGASGSFICNGELKITNGTTVLSYPIINTSYKTLDTTASEAVDFNITWGTASSSNTCTATNIDVGNTIANPILP